MAQNTTLAIPAKSWTQISNADVTVITFQNLTNDVLLLKATATAEAPTDNVGSISYGSMQGERAVTLADLFPGFSTAKRLYVWSPFGGAVFVSQE